MGNTNNLELNKGDNFIFLIDVSLSMKTTDAPGGLSRIEFLKEQVITFAKEASKYDTDGIDVVTFGHGVKVYEGITADKAESIIRGLAANEGSTDTAAGLAKAWELHKAYKARGGQDQTVVFAATDGAPNDRNAVISTLRKIAAEQEADNEDFSVSFLTVGEIDGGLRAFLTTLDDDLNAKDKNGNAVDIVDVKALAEVDFMSAFIGAVHD
jgi:Mg-chelatase subunit ChlD